MPHTHKFEEMLEHMEKFYGHEKGKKIAYATAKKRHIKIDKNKR